MMNEEQYIKSRLGEKNPFRVPDGYFDSFATELMQKLPEQTQSEQIQPEKQKPSRLVTLRPWLYAAACLFVALFTATIFFVAPDDSSQQVAATTTTATDEKPTQDEAPVNEANEDAKLVAEIIEGGIERMVEMAKERGCIVDMDEKSTKYIVQGPSKDQQDNT